MYVFSLQTIKDRALCFSTTKSAARVAFLKVQSKKNEKALINDHLRISKVS